MNYIDKILWIVPREVSGDIDLVMVRKNPRDQRDTLGHGESATD
jgi:hypothetical protein